MTEPTVSIPSIDVLMNRGFRVVVHKVVQDPNGGWMRESDSDGNATSFETFHVRVNNWVTACIEQEFGGMDEWQSGFETKSFSTLSATFAIMEDKYIERNGVTVPDAKYGALRMKDGEVMEYAIAVSNAMLLSQGVSPELVGEVAEKSIREMRSERSKVDAEMRTELLAENDTPTSPSPSLPSEPTSETGSKSDEMLTSIGPSAPQ